MVSPNEPAVRALVTGASSGIGAALSRRLAARGVEVWLAARRQDRLDEQVQAIRGAGGKAHALVLDVCDGAGAAERVSRLDEEVGGIDLVVANAGMGVPDQGPATLTFAGVRTVFDTNLTGAMAVLVPLTARMMERGRGHVVAVSSLNAKIPLTTAAPYGASKAALSFYVEAIRPAVEARGVAVTLVHPGFVRTPMTEAAPFPMPFLMDLDVAVARIDRAILRRRRRVDFPLGLRVLIALGALAPARLRYEVTRRAIRPTAGTRGGAGGRA
jgi:short-subunit dehydrogenase